MNNSTLYKETKQLAKIAYSGVVPRLGVYSEENITMSEIEDTLRANLKELTGGSYWDKRRNKEIVFQLISEAVGERIPRDVKDALGVFADVRHNPQGAKQVFNVRAGKRGVKRFVTAVGLGGIYKRVRLDTLSITLDPINIGGAVWIEFEQYLDGAFDFYDLAEYMVEQILISINYEVKKALDAAVEGLPAKQKESGAGFVEDSIVRLRQEAKKYGDQVALVCTETFASKIEPLTDQDKEDKRNTGMVKKALGMDIVVLPNGEDEDGNTIFEDNRAYIIPTGQNADDKFVKIALEGETVINETQGTDMSMNIGMYQKAAVGVITTDALFVYEDTTEVEG